MDDDGRDRPAGGDHGPGRRRRRRRRGHGGGPDAGPAAPAVGPAPVGAPPRDLRPPLPPARPAAAAPVAPEPVAPAPDTGPEPALAPARHDVPIDPDSVLDDLEVDGWDESRKPIGVVDVELSRLGQIMPFDAQGIALVRGERVVVATSRGLEMGSVVRPARVEMRRTHDLPKVIRRAGAGDQRQYKRNIEKADEARALAQRKIREIGLPMKVVEVEILHGGARAIVHFESDERVDFRQLVRELAEELRLRIDLRQVGVRDSSRLVGALGRCGQPVCCSRFLRGFFPVSIRMAKDQNLPLTPDKVSGVCGRLLCCLGYEHEGYRSLKEGLPKTGRRIATPEGEGFVRDVDILRRRVTLEMADGQRKTFTAEELALPGSSPCAAGEPCGGPGPRPCEAHPRADSGPPPREPAEGPGTAREGSLGVAGWTADRAADAGDGNAGEEGGDGGDAAEGDGATPGPPAQAGPPGAAPGARKRRRRRRGRPRGGGPAGRAGPAGPQGGEPGGGDGGLP